MDDYLLPQLLPPHWHNQLEVAWSQPTGATATTLSATATEPSIGFIRLLWQWLGDREDVAEVAHWPLLPLVGGCLRLLIQPAQVSMSCTCITKLCLTPFMSDTNECSASSIA